MKHILKRFNFGVFDYKDAEKLLNQMADKGYRFLSDGNFIFGDFAMFEKDEKARETKYTVDVRCELSESEKENYYDFYKDLGWKNIGCHRKKLHIFIADKNNNFPLYTDEFSEMANLNEAIKKDARIIKNSIYALFFACLVWYMIYSGPTATNRLASYVFIIFFTLPLIYKVLEIFNNVIFKYKLKKALLNEQKIPDNKTLKELKVWENLLCVTGLVSFSAMGIIGYCYEIWGAGVNPSEIYGTTWAIAMLAIDISSIITMLTLTYVLFLYPNIKKNRSAYFIAYFISYIAYYFSNIEYIKLYLVR